MTDENFNVSPIDLKAAIIRVPLSVSSDTSLIKAITKLDGSHIGAISPGSPAVIPQSPGKKNNLPAATSAILVVENRQVLGIVTERDIVRFISQGGNLENQTIQQVMTHPVITAQEAELTDLFSTLKRFQAHGIRHLPLLDEQSCLSGLITLTSLQRLVRPLELLRLRLANEVMHPNVACASPELSVLELAQRMVSQKLGALVIVEGSPSNGDSKDCEPHSQLGQPLGIVTERDLVTFQALTQNSKQTQAQDIMSQPLLTVRPNESLWEIQKLMEQRRTRRVVVTDDSGELLGMITQQDLLQALNPVELYNLAEILEKRVALLEAKNVQLLQERTAKLEQQAEQERLLSELTQQIRSSLSMRTILNTTAIKLRQVLDCDRVNIWQFAPDWSSTAVAESTQSSLSLLGEQVSDLFIPPTSSSRQTEILGDIRIINDINQAELSEAHRDWLLRLQAHANISIPLRCGEQAWGWLQVSESQHARQWTTEEVDLLRALSAQLAIALQQATTHQQLQAELSIRKQAEEKLREAEERYRGIYDQATVGFASMTSDKKFQDVNFSFCKMLGYSRQELLSKTPAEVTHPKDRAPTERSIRRLLSGEVSFVSLEKRCLRKDRSFFWAQADISLLRGQFGQPQYVLAVIQDISERKRAELALNNLILGTSKTTGKMFFPALVQHIGKALNVDYVLVSELLEDKLQVLAYCHDNLLQPTFEFPLANTPCEQVCATGRLYIEHCVQKEFPDHLDLVKMQAESYLGIALKSIKGKVIGNLCLLSKQPIQDLHRAEQILQVFAARASVELERKRSNTALEELNKALESKVEFRTSELKSQKDTIRQHAVREKLLRVVSQRIRKSLDLEMIFQTACHEVRKVLRADRVGVYQFKLGSNHSSGKFVAESVAKEFTSVLNQEIQDSAFGENYSLLYSKGRFFASSDINVDIPTECHRNLLADFQVQATLVMPLLCKGKLWGLLCIHQCESTRDWQQSEIDFSKQLVNQLAIAIQQANLFEQLQQELSERQQTQVALSERNVQLAITNEELARATRLKDEFLANMSHELRTPLNAILGMSECLKENLLGEITAKQKNALETIHSSGSHLLSLINEILDLSKIQAGQIKLQLQPVSIASLCDSSLIFVKQQALKKRIQLSSNFPEDLSHLFLLDQRRILQCLINLLTNAVKFTDQGGSVTLTVTYTPPSTELTENHQDTNALERSEPQHLLEFSIADTGIGIAPENIDKLFQPFIQIDSSLSRKYDGTGLGLALVKRIVELHGGNVSVESKLGQGSIFQFQLPCRRDQSASALPMLTNNNVETAGLPVEANNQSLPLILLAEDNEAGISTFKMFLSSKGYRLEIARNGIEAISLAQAKHPDLILMDIQMPEMDGLEAMRQIRLDPSLAKVPIIALTALAMKGDQERCLAAGANDYLSKPVKLTQLVGAIDKLLVASV